MDTDSPPQGLFFAGSDDGNDSDDVLIEEPQPGAATPESESKPRLFFADSDDDEETHASTFTTPMKRSISVHIENDASFFDGQSSDVEIPSFEEIPRASSVSSMSSALSGKDKDSSPAPYIESTEPPTKKMRMSSPFTASQPPFESIYIGSFIVGNAWSTVRGKGYVKSGDEIQVEREDQDERPSFKESGVSKKGKKGKAMDKGKTKQLSIANMMKAPQPKMSKKKTNTVVRLTNSRGFGMFFCLSRCHWI
jgi:DNA repair protein RAD5